MKKSEISRQGGGGLRNPLSGAGGGGENGNKRSWTDIAAKIVLIVVHLRKWGVDSVLIHLER